jgi:hypothetical protein
MDCRIEGLTDLLDYTIEGLKTEYCFSQIC